MNSKTKGLQAEQRPEHHIASYGLYPAAIFSLSKPAPSCSHYVAENAIHKTGPHSSIVILAVIHFTFSTSLVLPAHYLDTLEVKWADEFLKMRKNSQNFYKSVVQYVGNT